MTDEIITFNKAMRDKAREIAARRPTQIAFIKSTQTRQRSITLANAAAAGSQRVLEAEHQRLVRKWSE